MASSHPRTRSTSPIFSPRSPLPSPVYSPASPLPSPGGHQPLQLEPLRRGALNGKTDMATAKQSDFRMLQVRPPVAGLQNRRATRRAALQTVGATSSRVEKATGPSTADLLRTRRLRRIEKQLNIAFNSDERSQTDYGNSLPPHTTKEDGIVGYTESWYRCRRETEEAVQKLVSKVFPPPSRKVEIESKMDLMYCNYRLFFDDPVTLRSGRKVFLGACHCESMENDEEEEVVGEGESS